LKLVQRRDLFHMDSPVTAGEETGPVYAFEVEAA